MKLMLRRKVSLGTTKIEDEIYLEDDSPPMVQYRVPSDEKIDGYALPETSDYIRTVVSQHIVVDFPLVEKLCREIFDSGAPKG